MVAILFFQKLLQINISQAYAKRDGQIDGQTDGRTDGQEALQYLPSRAFGISHGNNYLIDDE